MLDSDLAFLYECANGTKTFSITLLQNKIIKEELIDYINSIIHR